MTHYQLCVTSCGERIPIPSRLYTQTSVRAGDYDLEESTWALFLTYLLSFVAEDDVAFHHAQAGLHTTIPDNDTGFVLRVLDLRLKVDFWAWLAQK